MELESQTGEPRRQAASLDDRVRDALAPELDVVRVLGEGSSARVYLARERALDRHVSVKVLRTDASADPESRGRFLREARALASLVHPNVVAVHRFGVMDGGEPYLVMQYAHGRTLEQRLAGEARLDPLEVRRILGDMADGLAAAHAHGIVHRDIRPDNVFCDAATGRALISDFGIVGLTEGWTRDAGIRLTKTGERLGDPRYASPEQLRGQPVTESADVYSMALVAHEMLTGRAARGDDLGVFDALVARTRDEPLRLPDDVADRDPDLADLLRVCLSPDPLDRPSAASVAHRLGRGTAPDERDAGAWPAAGVWRALRRRRVPQWVAATVAGGWAGLSVVDQLVERGKVVEGFYDFALVTGIAAVPAAAVVAWFHGARGPQRPPAAEHWILAALVVVWIVTLGIVLL